MSTYSSGWVSEDKNGTAVASNAVLLFEHNLGTTDVTVDLWMATGAAGNGVKPIHNLYAGGSLVGGGVTGITPTTITIRLHPEWVMFNGNGTVSTSGWADPYYPYIKVVVSAGASASGGQSSGGGSEGGTYDSGWLAATANADTSFTHGLGTNAIHTQIFHSASSDGSNASVAGDILDSSGNTYGARVHSITSSQLVVETGYSATTAQWGNGTEWGGGYIRVIASSILGGSSGSSGGSGGGVSNVFAQGFIDLNGNVTKSINIASATHTSTFSDAYRTFEVNLTNGPSSDHDSYNVQIAVRTTSEDNDTAAITTYRWASPTQILVRVNGYNNPANVDGISILVLDDVSVGGSSAGTGTNVAEGCEAIGSDCRTAISELNSVASIDDLDEFILTTNSGGQLQSMKTNFSLLKAKVLEPEAGTPSLNEAANIEMYARAYFEPPTMTIHKQEGFASIEKIYGGRYKFTFNSPLPDTNYTVLSTQEWVRPLEDACIVIYSTKTTDSFEVGTSNDNSAWADANALNVVVFR